MFDEGEERGARVSKKGKKASLEDGEPPPVSLACVSTRGDRVSETVEDRATGPTQDATVVVPAGAANIELEPRSVGETTVAVGGARAKQASLDPRRLPACLPLTAIPFDPFESRQQQGAYTTRSPVSEPPFPDGMARILGFGTDLLRTGRIGELVRRRGLAQLARRILTADEQRALDQVIGQPAQERFLAVRYVRQGCARLSLNFLSLV
jgi:hypothetical protein